ncbi:hypothetical protein K438DRAFT_1779306 [Mycena galopus ATCC 62051]|nr:hypothetical protein K438DRAFT_1779306 [Mycena galopus ATCC 62051]
MDVGGWYESAVRGLRTIPAETSSNEAAPNFVGVRGPPCLLLQNSPAHDAEPTPNALCLLDRLQDEEGGNLRDAREAHVDVRPEGGGSEGEPAGVGGESEGLDHLEGGRQDEPEVTGGVKAECQSERCAAKERRRRMKCRWARAGTQIIINLKGEGKQGRERTCKDERRDQEE